MTGGTFLAASQVVGLGFVVLGWYFLRNRDRLSARRLFLASILYLPVVLGLGVADMTRLPAPTVASAVATVADASAAATPTNHSEF